MLNGDVLRFSCAHVQEKCRRILGPYFLRTDRHPIDWTFITIEWNILAICHNIRRQEYPFYLRILGVWVNVTFCKYQLFWESHYMTFQPTIRSIHYIYSLYWLHKYSLLRILLIAVFILLNFWLSRVGIYCPYVTSQLDLFHCASVILPVCIFITILLFLSSFWVSWKPHLLHCWNIISLS